MAAQDVIDALNLERTELDQTEDTFEARNEFKSAYDAVVQHMNAVAEIAAAGSFGTIPATIKQPMLRIQAAFQTCLDTIDNDEETAAVINWSP